MYCLKQQLYIFLLIAVVTSASYLITTYYGFREPISLSIDFFIGFAFIFIFFGAYMRLVLQQAKAN